MNIIKNKKVIILIGIAIFLIIFRLITNKTTEENIEKYLENKGFKLNPDTDIYEKQTSEINIDEYYNLTDNLTNAEYSALYFNTKNFTLLKDSMTYSNEITSIFNATYNYKDESLTYIYEVSKDNTVIMFEGNYVIDTEEFSCSVTYYDNIDNPYENSNDMKICEKISSDTKNFAEETRTLITKPSLLEKMKEE